MTLVLIATPYAYYQTAQASIYGSSLVLWWSLDTNDISGTSVTDYSGNSNTGSTVNTPPSVTGVVGQALSFNGSNQYVLVNNSASIRPPTTMTVSAWVYPTDLTVTQFHEIYRQENGNDRILFSFQHGGTECSGGTGGTGGCVTLGISTGGVYAESDVNISSAAWLNKWSLVTAVYDGSNKIMYQNGLPIGSVAASGAIGTTGAAQGYLASDRGGELFAGNIDDFRMYNRALSPAEVMQLYYQGASKHGDIF